MCGIPLLALLPFLLMLLMLVMNDDHHDDDDDHHVVDAGDDHHDDDGDHSDGEESNDEIDNDDDYLDKYCKSILCEYPGYVCATFGMKRNQRLLFLSRLRMFNASSRVLCHRYHQHHYHHHLAVVIYATRNPDF